MHDAPVIKPQQLLADHLDKTPFALIAWDAGLRILSWSHQAEVLFGWKEDEVKGRHFSDFPFVYPDDLELVGSNAAPLMRGEADRFTGTIRNLRKDGSVVHCAWYGFVARDAMGRMLSFLSLVQDVTEKTRQDAALQQANDRLSLLTTATNDGIWEWDLENNQVWANEVYCTTFGYNPADYADFYTEWLRRLHPDDREPFLQGTAAAWQRREKTWSAEFRFRLASGAYGTILQKVHFMYGPGGKVQRAVGVDIDVTGLRHTEAALRFHEQQLEIVYNTVGDVLYLLDVKGEDLYRFVTVNEAFLSATGLQREAVLGRRVQDVLPEPSLSLVLAKYRQAIATRRRVQWEEVTPFPAGTRTGIVSVTPVYNDGGVCVQLVGAVHDITDQKTVAGKLSQSYQEIRLLAAHLQDVREEERTTIAREIHDELGQLLTALKMEISWLKKADALTPLQVGQRVAAANALLDQAINTVRSISAELRPSILDDLGLGEALTWQSQEFEKRYGIAVRLRIDTPEVELPRDVSTAFFRIFQEALTNVARHAGAHHVTAALVLSGENLVLQVSDDGSGFELEKIAAQKTLGLMGIRERLEAINGQFDIQTAPGRGTALTIAAPCVHLKRS